jgi:TATA-binding protein-associated factor Taf7
MKLSQLNELNQAMKYLKRKTYTLITQTVNQIQKKISELHADLSKTTNAIMKKRYVK